ncbi:MAG: hypothetical protein M3O28_05115 [Actinomycetota bacterium]|nr:hypothetical protein [Actinomycetota bacterium]
MRSSPDRIVLSTQPTAPGTGPATMTAHDADSRRCWAHEVAVSLASMLPDERAFILSSYCDGLAHAAIAANAGVSDAFVRRTIASGLRKLSVGLENSYRPTDVSAPVSAPLLTPSVSRWGRRTTATGPIMTTDATSY